MSILLKSLPVFCLILTVSSRDRDDAKLQAAFRSLTGDMATLRDGCLTPNSLKIEDLKDFGKEDDVPEPHRCFYKCFYEKMGIIDGNGNVNMDQFNAFSAASFGERTEAEIAKTQECVSKAGAVKSCADMKKLEMCFD